MSKFEDDLDRKGTRHDREYFSYTDCGGKVSKRVKVCQDEGETIKVDLLDSYNAKHNELLDEIRELKKILLFSKNSNMNLVDGKGSHTKNKINKYNAIKVFNQGIPDSDDPVLQIPISDYFRDANDNLDARADGSLVNPIDFFVSAKEDTDVYINSLSFRVADQNCQLNQWGTIGQLTNGIQLIYKSQEIGERILVDNIRTNFDLIRACQGDPAFSQGAESFRATNISGQSEGYLPNLKLESFGLPFGIRLKAGTIDKLIVRVRDDITGIDAFDIFYYATELIN